MAVNSTNVNVQTTIPQTNSLSPETTSDSTSGPGFTGLTGGEKAKGTDQAERGTMANLQMDKDNVINMGGGSDVFVFSSTNGPEMDLNGIVDMGTGIDDIVYLNFQITDYVFTLRADGGIKIEYIGADEGAKGDAITFRNADTFIFRNFDSVTKENFANTEFTYDALATLIATHAGG